MQRLLNDLRFVGRSLLKRPGFTAVVVATLAIGVGANSAIFSVVNGVLLEPIPVREPARLVVPDVISPLGFSISLSIPNFRDWRERNRVFESFGAVMTCNQTLTGLDRPQVIEARLFGVMAYQVVQRVREIGIRMALGATAGSVVRMVTAQGLTITGMGVVLGLAGALLMSRLMTSLLFEVNPVDPKTYAALAALIVVISAVAAFVPARWATRVDPAVVLREE